MPPITSLTEEFPIRMKRILFATNFTETSAAALPYAAAFARRFNAEICATHIIPHEEYAHLEPAQRDETVSRMKQTARKRIKRLLAQSRFNDIRFRIILDHGDVMETISKVVESEQIDLIVAGSHGRHGPQKLVFPAVDESIARMAECPVLLVGPHVVLEPAAETDIQRILHPCDFRTYSGAGLKYSYALAQAYGADLYLLHITENAWDEPLSTRVTPEAFFHMRLAENELPSHPTGIGLHFQVEFGPPESLILEAAETHAPQLIVMGVPSTNHPELWAHFPGPLVYDIASHALCPVLAVRHPVRQEGKS
jgi:nucleotide-binding universal stress UspA family protein